MKLKDEFSVVFPIFVMHAIFQIWLFWTLGRPPRMQRFQFFFIKISVSFNSIPMNFLKHPHISHSSVSWEVQDEGAERIGVWWRLLSDSALLLHPWREGMLCSHVVEEIERENVPIPNKPLIRSYHINYSLELERCPIFVKRFGKWDSKKSSFVNLMDSQVDWGAGRQKRQAWVCPSGGRIWYKSELCV